MILPYCRCDWIKANEYLFVSVDGASDVFQNWVVFFWVTERHAIKLDHTLRRPRCGRFCLYNTELPSVTQPSVIIIAIEYQLPGGDSSAASGFNLLYSITLSTDVILFANSAEVLTPHWNEVVSIAVEVIASPASLPLIAVTNQ